MLDFIINILSTPAILVGLLACIGMMLQKKPVEDVVKSTIKTIVGFLVLSAGSSFLQSGSLLAFGDLFNYAFNMQGVVANSEAAVSLALNDFATSTAYIMALGMVLNIVLARFSKMRYIFLTGHHTLYMAAMISILLSTAGLEGVMLVLGGGMVLAFIMCFSPMICEPTMKKIVHTDQLGFGHFGGIGYWFSAQVAKVFKGSKSTEDIKFPQRLTFLRDTTVSISMAMMIFFVVICAVAVGKGILAADPNMILADYPNLGGLLNVGAETQTNWIVWCLTSGMNFAAAIYIILSGVRLIVGELVPAFKGIAETLVPGAVPAIDCPVVFPYAPNAVLIGFLTSFVGGVIGMIALILLNKNLTPIAIILPSVVPHFFCGATAGVFGNAEGGLKGCVAGSFAHGLLITFLPALSMPVFTALGFANTTFSDADFSVLATIFGNLANIMPGMPVFIICLILFVAPIVWNVITSSKNKETELSIE
ncbi:PTS ascorbate transporter subunit IIC [uncultured Dubosiella sp.]|uniref:PTS ascorbate transporter subunit IIC n=1 Tax=uncultured Dubosiella sp. TaxID=1937011 RepID=UPI00272FCC55|nr:PTS ascorbate transporter subunit IIC [uncultured Dubosiella sp.]